MNSRYLLIPLTIYGIWAALSYKSCQGDLSHNPANPHCGFLGGHCGKPPHCGQPPHCGKPPHCGQPPIGRHCSCKPGAASWRCALAALATPFRQLAGILRALLGSDTPSSLCARCGLELREKPIRVAFISVWGIACGIATYNAHLIEHLRKFVEVRVFAEFADEARSVRLPGDPQWVVRCWHRLDHPKTQLIAEIETYAPSLVHFGHEYGLWPYAFMFTNLVSTLRGLGLPVLATMHSVYEHLDKLVTESAGQSLLVHTNAAKICLTDKGIDPAQVTVIPHGTKVLEGTADNPVLLPSLWNTWNAPMLFTPGFLFSYKGHERMLRIIANLKARFPTLHYVIQASENPNSKAEHDTIYARLMKVIKDLGIEAMVTINRGFVAEEILLSHIRTAAAVVLPYANHPAHDVRATSGIARLVLATETPLITSTVHLFDDLEGVVSRCATDGEIEAEIVKILTDGKVKAVQIARRIEFLKTTTFAAVAHRTAILYESIVRKIAANKVS